MNDREAIAGFRILALVARADGVIKDEEKEAMAAALEGRESPTLDEILNETYDLAEELAAIVTPAVRAETYKSAYALANADGECSAEEKALLERIRQGFGLDASQTSLLDRVLRETKETVLLSAIDKIDDPELRAKEIREDTLKYSVFSAVLGAFPIPGIAIATDLAVVALQAKLVRDIGQYYGHKLDARSARAILGGLSIGTAARIAVANLVKFVPGWGSVFGATSSFAATFALGKIVDSYFAGGAKGDLASFKADFKAAEKEGKKAYEANKEEIAKKKEATKAEIEKLNAALEKGDITQAEYEQGTAKLA